MAHIRKAAVAAMVPNWRNRYEVFPMNLLEGKHARLIWIYLKLAQGWRNLE